MAPTHGMETPQVMIPISRPVIGNEEIEAVAAVLRSGQVAQGDEVRVFEEAFAAAVGARYAIAVNSGTAALHLALLAHGVGMDDEVVTTPFSFAATANSVLFAGARPVFADIEEDTFNIAPQDLAGRITPRTRAILPVHLYGQPCEMKEITELAEKHGIAVIQDACQAHGAGYEGQPLGSLSTACFSFYATKNMSTGEGGMMTTNDPDVAQRARAIRNHGQNGRYLHEVLGFNYRMTDIAAAMGRCQLAHLDERNTRRMENADTLSAGLSGIAGLMPPVVRPNVKHVFHQYTARVTDGFPLSRDELREQLRDAGIATEVYYPLPLHRQPLYRSLGYRDGLPNAEKAAEEVLSLPVHPSLTTGELAHIVGAVSVFGAGGGR